jgi:hypothetical protein
MTDGYIGNDREVVACARGSIWARRGSSASGVGDSVNRYLLEALARVGRGASTFITLDESTERAADELYQRIEHPALSDLKFDWGAMSVSDVQPQPLPDLFVGRPVVLTGRFKGRVRARDPARRPLRRPAAGDGDRREPGRAGIRHAALAAVWARSKITSLHDRALGSADTREVVDEIRRVALQYGLMSELDVVRGGRLADAHGGELRDDGRPARAGAERECATRRRWRRNDGKADRGSWLWSPRPWGVRAASRGSRWTRRSRRIGRSSWTTGRGADRAAAAADPIPVPACGGPAGSALASPLAESTETLKGEQEELEALGEQLRKDGIVSAFMVIPRMLIDPAAGGWAEVDPDAAARMPGRRGA